MIDKQHIAQILDSYLEAHPGLFLVDLSVGASGKIVVSVDTPEGVTIDECVALSRFIEQSLDRETEDFELEVSSPGLTEPFKVEAQYHKHLGQQITLVLVSGTKLAGALVSVLPGEGIMLEYKQKVKEAGMKKAVVQSVQQKILFNEIKTTKVLITF
jgi:ribosome maturation factor RimP